MLEWPPSRRGLTRLLCLAPAVLAPLLGGTARRPYTMIVAALCGAAGLLAALDVNLQHRADPQADAAGGGASGRTQIMASWFAAALAGALGITLVQLLPLPPGLRALVAPGSDPRLRQILAGLYGASGAAVAPRLPLLPISGDPSATANEAVRLGGYLCLLLGLGAAFPHRGESRLLSRAVCVGAGLIAVLGVLSAAHVPLPAPLDVGPSRARLAAAFVNSNHQAALLSIGAIMTTGLFLSASAGGRVALLALLLLLNAALLSTLSRGGIAVGVAGQLLVLLWPRGSITAALRASRSAAAARRALLPVLLVGAVIALCAVFTTEAQRDLEARLSEVSRRDLTTPGSKITAWTQALPLLGGHLWLGVGRGAFENAFQGYSTVSSGLRFIYLENEWLQTVVDFGVPGGLLVIGLICAGMAAALRRLRRDRRRHHFAGQRVAAFVALVALGLHNLVDFNLEVGGVAIPALVLCAVVLRGRFAVPRWALPALSVGVLLGAPLCGLLAESHEEAGQRLRRAAEDAQVSRAEVLRLGQAAVRAHPLDSYLSALVGTRLLKERDPQTVEWLNRALLANPNDVLALRSSAVLLASRGYAAQAQGTLRYAIGRADYPGRLLLYDAAAAIARRPQDVAAALPESAAVADEALEYLGSRQPPAVVQEVAAWAEARGATTAPIWLATAALSRRDADAAERWGSRVAEGDGAEFLLTNVIGLLAEAGRLEPAEALAKKALRRSQSAPLLLSLAAVRERRGAAAEAQALHDQALGVARDRLERAQVHESRAGLEERLGNVHRPQQERLEAARLRQGN